MLRITLSLGGTWMGDTVLCWGARFDKAGTRTLVVLVVQNGRGFVMSSLDTTVFVVDPDPESCKTIATLVGSLGNACWTFPSAEEFLCHLAASRPNCAVIELCLPGMNGFELQEHLISQGISTPLIFVGAAADVPAAVRVMRNGAVTLLKKPFSGEDLALALRTAIDRDAATRTARAKHAEMRYRIDQLHDRERETLQLILAGFPNKTIARKLGVSRRTVERIRAAAFEKLGAESALDVVRIVEGTGDFHAFASSL
jgi:FixJ family two-component response regulator